MTDYPDIQVGNAQIDASRGWFVGNFIDEKFGLRHSDDVEIKWRQHPAGEERPQWVTHEVRTTVFILITGTCELEFRDRTVRLSKPGDFVMWGKGQDHKWRAVEDYTALTVRWPSIHVDSN